MEAFDMLVYLVAELEEKSLPKVIDLYFLEQWLHFLLQDSPMFLQPAEL